MTLADLHEAQRWAAGEALGLRRQDIHALAAMADGCTPRQIADRLGHTPQNTYTRLKQIGERLGVPGTASDPVVRQAMLDVAFRAGMFPERPVIPLDDLDDLQVHRPTRFNGEALNRDEIAAAPSVPDELVPAFKAWRVENLPVVQGSGMEQGVGHPSSLREQLTAALGDPNPRRVVAIAAKDLAEGKLTAAELAQAQRWAVADELGISRLGLDLLDHLARGSTEDGITAAFGLGGNYLLRNQIARLGASLGVPVQLDPPVARQPCWMKRSAAACLPSGQWCRSCRRRICGATRRKRGARCAPGCRSG